MENKTKTLAEVLTIIKEKGYQLDFDVDVPIEFKGNTYVIASIMEHSSLDFDKLPESAKNDRQVLILIANKSSWKFSNFPEWAKDDKEIIKSLSDIGGEFENISERLRADREIVLLGLSGHSSNNLEHVASEELKNDKEILKIAVSGHGQALHWVPEKWRHDKELLDIILSKKVYATHSFEHFPPEYRDNEDIAKKVVGDDAGCFEYLSERLRNNKEIAIIAASGARYALGKMPDSMLDDKDVVLSAVQNHELGGYIEKISDRLKKDIEVVIAAVLKDNRSLEYFPDEFKNDNKVIEACLKGHGSAYKYFSERFKNDKNIALQMSAKWDFDLSAAPEIFRNDKEIVKNAVKENANNYQYIGKDLLSDLDYLRELHVINDGILSHMDEEIKTKLFTTTIESVEHYGRKIIYEMVLDDGYVQNNQRSIEKGIVKQGDIELFRFSSFPVLTYEEDGPVGSYLSVRCLNNILLIGNFVFFIKENTGKETWTNSLSRGNQWQGYGPEPKTNDDFLKHEVYLIPESAKNIEYNNLSKFPRIYFGRPNNLPSGIKLFPAEESYREALTVLKQENTYGEPKFKKLNDNTLEADARNADEVFGAARVYVDKFEWRFLIPHEEGALKALEVLKSTTDIDDLNWIKAQNGNLSELQVKLLKEHFGNNY